MPSWRNWHTQQLEGLWSFGPCGFESHRGHLWAVSSAGRVSRLHREGRRFEPYTAHYLSPGDGTGIHATLKMSWAKVHVGSNPTSGIKKRNKKRLCNTAGPFFLLWSSSSADIITLLEDYKYLNSVVERLNNY